MMGDEERGWLAEILDEAQMQMQELPRWAQRSSDVALCNCAGERQQRWEVRGSQEEAGEHSGPKVEAK